MIKYNAIWKHDNTKRSDEVLKNSDALANRLGKNIHIARHLSGCSEPKRLYSLLLNELNYDYIFKHIKQMPLLKDKEGIERFKLAKEKLNRYSHKFADHEITIKTHNKAVGAKDKIIGVGWSPYIDPRLINDKLCDSIKSDLLNIMDAMSPEFKNKYDLIILSPKETIYEINYTITILFMKK